MDPSDMLAALGPLVLEHHFRPGDFVPRYEGYLTVADIRRFDDMWWLQVQSPRDLLSFRAGAFQGAPREMPPIIVVTYPLDGTRRTEIRDGRGRVNFANAYGLRLHVWHVIHRNCQAAHEEKT
jgi:hypothetical protein